MKKTWIILSIVVVLAGIITSALLVDIHFDIQKDGLENESFCSFSETNNCDIVAASSYASIFRIPIAGFSLLYYSAFLLLLIAAYYAEASREPIAKFLLWFSIPSFIATIYMIYVSMFILGVVCILCIALYAVSVILLLIFFVATQKFPDRFKLSRQYRPCAITVLVVFGVGFIFLKSAAANLEKGEISPEIAAAAHFKGSLHDLNVQVDDPVWGEKDAVVTVLEFSDFQCPHCKVASFKLRPYLAEFKNKVRFVYLHYPLDPACHEGSGPLHQRACLAAYGAECARKAGKFWEYHDDLFRNQRKISKNLLFQLAEKHNFDRANFETCIESPATISKVKADIERGKKAGIRGTPAIFINNRNFRFWKNPYTLRQVVREEIFRSSAK